MGERTRRRVLGLSGTALMTALAGCGIPGGGEEDEEEDEDGGGGEEDDEDGEAEDGEEDDLAADG